MLGRYFFPDWPISLSPALWRLPYGEGLQLLFRPSEDIEINRFIYPW